MIDELIKEIVELIAVILVFIGMIAVSFFGLAAIIFFISIFCDFVFSWQMVLGVYLLIVIILITFSLLDL